MVAFLLKQPSVDINRQGQDGHTGTCTANEWEIQGMDIPCLIALHSACYHNHSFTVELLLEEGADPSMQTYSQNDSEDGETCADWAYARGALQGVTVSKQIVIFLLYRL